MSRNQVFYAALAAIIALLHDYKAYIEAQDKNPDARFDFRMAVIRVGMAFVTALGVAPALPEV